MIGAIAGDIIGSVYEYSGIKTKLFPLLDPQCHFTDDSVLTIAVAQAILDGRPYAETVRELGRRYPAAGYGMMFTEWLGSEDPQPYNSFGNGSAMRVAPVGFAFTNEQDVMREAAKSAEFSHNHPEGIKGAQATALAIYLARSGATREDIARETTHRFGYNLKRCLSDIRPGYSFNETCQRTVPEALIAFLESDSWEDAVRNAISLGGDSDTLACITGGIAQAFYGSIPDPVLTRVKKTLPDDLWAITDRFCNTYPVAGPTSASRRRRDRAAPDA